MLERAGEPIAFSGGPNHGIIRVATDAASIRINHHNLYRLLPSILFLPGQAPAMEFVADALSFGTVIHQVLAEFYRSKMRR
jgi:hypothetical protein